MNNEYYIKFFGDINITNFIWSIIYGDRYYENIFPTKSSELFCDRNNNILKYNKVISGSGLEFVDKWHIHNKILES